MIFIIEILSRKSCISCKEAADANNENNGNNKNYQYDQWDVDNVNEMCENLYKQSAKCESTTGLTNGFIQTQRNEEDNNNNNNENDIEVENQYETEFMACTYIQSMLWNSYTQKGEINFYDPQDIIFRSVTTNQKRSLGFIAFIFTALLGVVFYYNKRIHETIVDPEVTTNSRYKVTSSGTALI